MSETVVVKRKLLEEVANALNDAGHLDLFVRLAKYVKSGEDRTAIDKFHLDKIEERVNRCACLSHTLDAAIARSQQEEGGKA